MERTNLILIEQFCTHHNIEISFIHSLQDFGLIEVVVIDEGKYIAHERLPEIEKMIRLHYELDINMEGIDAISGLLQRVSDLQQQLRLAQNKLRLFEDLD